jgi:UDP-N-acetylmuramate dehydrogenase
MGPNRPVSLRVGVESKSVKAAPFAELSARLDGELRFDVPLARFTTYRIGGPAAALVHAGSVDDVARVLRFSHETGTPWLALGLGSNMLISDAGFEGIVLRVGKGLDRVERGGGAGQRHWRVGAGFPTPLLARRSARAGLSGVHRLVGVPGTVGGGVYMNAGAHGQDYSQVVRRVDLVDTLGIPRTVEAKDVPWRYRGSGLEGNVIVGATVDLVPADPRQLAREIHQHIRWRKAGTPFDEACCGSVFRNPPAGDGGSRGRTAGQLIDACGLKGFQIGGAQVSPKHANYIVNLGGARAADVLSVIDAVRERVRSEFGFELQLEVQIIGAW